MIIDAHMHLPVYCSNFEGKKRKLLSDMKTDNVDIGIVISDSELTSEIGSMDDCVELFASNCSNVFVAAGISPYINFKEQLSKLRKYLTAGQVIAIKLGQRTICRTGQSKKRRFGISVGSPCMLPLLLSRNRTVF